MLRTSRISVTNQNGEEIEYVDALPALDEQLNLIIVDGIDETLPQ